MRDQPAKRGSHLHGRALAAECKAGTHGEQPAEELDRHDAVSGGLHVTVENGFYTLDPAAFCCGRKPDHQDARCGGAQKSYRDRRQLAGVGPSVCPGDERIAPAIGGNQKVAKCAADQSDKNSR